MPEIERRSMHLLHWTGAACDILTGGFRDTPRGRVMIAGQLHRRPRGVYLADGYVDPDARGSESDQAVCVTVPDGFDMASYSIEDRGLGFREWAVPARIVNSWERRECSDVEVAILLFESGCRIGDAEGLPRNSPQDTPDPE